MEIPARGLCSSLLCAAKEVAIFEQLIASIYVFESVQGDTATGLATWGTVLNLGVNHSRSINVKTRMIQ